MAGSFPVASVARTRRTKRIARAAWAALATFAALATAVATPAAALATEAGVPDPLGSARWSDMRKVFFAGQPVVFDERVRIGGPGVAEDPLNVPLSVDASALAGVEEVVVFADFNPILKVLSFRPQAAKASLGFRLKLQQSSPVRAAARTRDGIWHVGGAWVTTTGGGCTAPSTGSGSPEWQERLNEVSGRIWPRVDGGERLRLRIIHPMDTGLAPGIPAFHLEDLSLADGNGAELMRIEPFEPVAENPLFTVDLASPSAGSRIHARGRDNNGNRLDAWVTR
jgi:sulfur-oxidizing protein SoxY